MTGDKKHDREKWASDLENYSRQIWLAGLGAYAKVGKEGVKLFETLIKDGEEAEKSAKANIEKKVEAFKTRAGKAKDQSADDTEPRAEKAWGKGSGRWTELEAAFDKRLGSALSRLGMPTRGELQALDNKIEELSRLVSELGAHRAAALSSAPAPVAPAAAAVHETTDKLQTEPEVAAAQVAAEAQESVKPELDGNARPEGKASPVSRSRAGKTRTASKARTAAKTVTDEVTDTPPESGQNGE